MDKIMDNKLNSINIKTPPPIEKGESFKRNDKVEKYFAAITSSPIVKIVIENDIPTWSKSRYAPRTIDYFYDRGFYPFSFNSRDNLLEVVVNMDFDWPSEIFDKDILRLNKGNNLENDEENERLEEFRGGFAFYETDFFRVLPQDYISKVKTAYNIAFTFISKEEFADLKPYVIDPSSIKTYNTQKKYQEDKNSGLVTDYDSVAGDILDAILTHAVVNRASDVHLEYDGKKYRTRIRVDGDLIDYGQNIDAEYYSPIINIIRHRCNLDIIEHFKPQDGNMPFEATYVTSKKLSSNYDIRVSIIPQVDGKLNAVMRIQVKGEFKTLSELGFSPKVYVQVKNICKEPHGLILVTGPTGSGKTTTLYSVLNEMNTDDVKILTVEDPVEIRMTGLTQVGVNEKQGRTFPTMLKHFLRHDPDIILVGEVRDAETAKIAVVAANTGHLVLTTLHTNDAISAIKRLATMESVDSADFAFSLKAVLAQRLIKTFRQDIRAVLIENHKHSAPFSPKAGVVADAFKNNKLHNIDVGEWLNKETCMEYFPIGRVFAISGEKDMFEGRAAITEFWKLGAKAQDLIFDKQFSTNQLESLAIYEDGMIPMAISGFEKAINGWTSLDEMIKSVGVEAMIKYKAVILKLFFEK